ncbi:MAG: radical SAM family heme chaperone HemW [Bacteroidales bacterium]|nr:radical SAM family heme chaperone HemW [Bacteroidales bacterium]
MAGIYLHIPFCRKKCHYCNFYSSASWKNKDAFVSALLQEIEIQKDYLQGESIKTIYFGGGTPSVLSKKELDLIFDQLNRTFEIEENAEITLEANPDDLSEEKLIELSKTRVNRLSIGVQSFNDRDLKILNRAHDSQRAIQVINNARKYGFDNLTIDLIYGIQGASNEVWGNNLNTVFELNIPHISCYSLTVEPKTPLENLIRKGKMPNVDEEQAIAQFEYLLEQMEAKGYQHYEISNFSKPGMHSRHNTAYWFGEKYLGLGPSAHSFDGNSRQWNVSNTSSYISNILKGDLIFEKEELSEDLRYNEYVMTSLRTMWGIDLDYLEVNFGATRFGYCLKVARRYHDEQKIDFCNQKICLTKKGKLFADQIAAEMFV